MLLSVAASRGLGSASPGPSPFSGSGRDGVYYRPSPGVREGWWEEAVHSVADLRGMLLSGVSLGWVLPGRPLLFVVPPPRRLAPCLRRPASLHRRGSPAGTPLRLGSPIACFFRASFQQPCDKECSECCFNMQCVLSRPCVPLSACYTNHVSYGKWLHQACQPLFCSSLCWASDECFRLVLEFHLLPRMCMSH